jgi:glycosyltransferase involved in cell wall biosynthesis
MTLPLLGLALDRRPPESLVPLLVALYRWCVPATIEPGAPEPAAVMATVASAGRVPPGRPLALWVGSAAEAASPAAGRAAAIVADQPAVVDAAGDRGVLAPAGDHAAGRSVVSPFVRGRLRWARGLPEAAVLEQAEDGWRWPGLAEPLADDLVPTAMACASAVAVAEPGRLLEAMAWGAPCVSDPGSAEQVGAMADADVLVGAGPGERRRLAADLAADQALASRLSWAGRRLVERRHDAGRAAMRLVDLLGLRPTLPEGALASARLQLALLGTPSDANIASRSAEATAWPSMR